MRHLIAVGVTALGVALVGCGGSSGSDDAGPAATGPASMRSVPATTPPGPTFDPATVAFTLADFPTGWVREPEGDEEDGRLCSTTGVFEGALAKAEGQFSDQGSVPQVSGTFAAFAPGGAEAAITLLREVLEGCGTDEVDGVEWSVAPTSFPAVGDESLAYLATTEEQGLSLNALLVGVRVGDGTAGIVYGDLGQLNTDAAEEYVRLGVGRLERAQGLEASRSTTDAP